MQEARSQDAVAALMRRAQRGDVAAFDALARRFLRPVYAVALALLGRPSEAEDVAQDAMVAAFERLEDCREPERFGGWILQIARNRAKNALLARRLRDVPVDAADGGGAGEARGQPSSGGVESASGSAEPPPYVLRARLLQALEALSPPQREVVLLHDLEGWTHAEIAQALGCSEVMSRQHLFTARRAMRAKLGEDDGVNHD